MSRRNAVIGGVTAAILFELAKYGFGIYVKSVPSYEAIYGAIAIVPTFLVWMYLSWVIVILGAHITFCLSAFRMDFEQNNTRDADWTFIDVFRLIFILWEAQKQGQSFNSSKMKKYRIKLPQFQVTEIMELLLSAEWVQRSSRGTWLLSRDLAEVTLLDLYRIIPRRLPEQMEYSGKDTLTKDLQQLLNKHNEDLDKLLSQPLRDFLSEAERDVKSL